MLEQIKYICGPYTRKKDNRKTVVLVYNDCHKRTVSWPKFMVEFLLCRELDPDLETIDHINDDETDNRLENLRIIPRKKHTKEDAVYVKTENQYCLFCGSLCKNVKKRPSERLYNSRQNKVGPFCSHSCAGKYGAGIQKGEQWAIEIKNNNSPKDYVLEREHFKKEKSIDKTVLDILIENNVKPLTEQEIINLLPRF